MAETAKPITSSKTFWLGLIPIIVGILNEFGPLAQKFADAEITRTALVSGIMMIVMRAVTKSPVVFPTKKN